MENWNQEHPLKTQLRYSIVGILAFATMAAKAKEQGDEIATCREPSGKSYYHFTTGLVSKKESGWHDDKISGGVFRVLHAQDGSFDILYVDGRNKPISMAQDGALVRFIARADKGFTLLAYYPTGGVAEIYSFFQENDGAHRFTMLQSKTGPASILHKSALFVGACD